MLSEVLSWLRTARNAWIAGKGEARARILAELEIPSTQQDAVRPQLPQPIFFSQAFRSLLPSHNFSADGPPLTDFLLLDFSLNRRKWPAPATRTLASTEYRHGILIATRRSPF